MFFILLSPLLLVLFSPLPSQAKMDKIFKAGAATTNITPFLGDAIEGGWDSTPASYVHDEIHARCLVLNDGKTSIVFIIVDNISLNSNLIDRAKERIYQETKIPPANVLVSATHTHSSIGIDFDGHRNARRPVMKDPLTIYQKFLIGRLTDVVRIAINNLEPAKIGWGVGHVPEHVFVRRYKMKPGTSMPNPFGGQDKVVMNPGRNPNILDYAGETDPEVSFMAVKSISGRPIALLANYSLHYVGGVPKGHLSADYFGVFGDRIRELLKADRLDPPFVGIMSNGTSGNVNNINSLVPRVKKEPYVQMRLVADDVAREVFRIQNNMTYYDWVLLGVAKEELALKVRKPTDEMLERAKWVVARPDTVKPIHNLELIYANRIIQHDETWPDTIDIVLQTFRIGDLGVAAIPFEVFAEIGLEIKAKSPFKQSFTIELANGGYGYLPRPEDHELGGYETWLSTNKVEIDASRMIVSKILDLLVKMHREQ